MIQVINKILLPIEFDASYMSVLKQTAELAKEHKAEIHILHIADTFLVFTNALIPPVGISSSYHEMIKNKMALLGSWKKAIEDEYGVKVKTAVELGDWGKTVLECAANIKADIIIVKDKPAEKKWYQFWRTSKEYVLEKSPCQVITLFSEKRTISEWKRIVIPVTSFIPELRIRTILNMAKIFRLKIHLVSLPPGENKKSPGFRFLTETLKLLKSNTNIQVECSFLDYERSPAHSFISFSTKIGADALMTNMKYRSPNNVTLFQKVINLFSTSSGPGIPAPIYPLKGSY